MQLKFIALVPLASLTASFVAAYPSTDAAALMERGFDGEGGLVFAREYDFADALEMRDFGDELEMRALDDELETRDFDDELEMRGFDDDLLEIREFDELDARDLEYLLERGLFSKKSPEEKKKKEEKKANKDLQKAVDKANQKSSLSINCKQCGSWEGKITARIQKEWKKDANIHKFESCEATAKDYNGGKMVTARYYNGNSVLNGGAVSSVLVFPSSITMRIATFNIRNDCKPDNISLQQSLDAFLNTDPLKEVAFQSLKGEQPWSTRRIHVASHILEEGAVLAAFQEALFRQVIDLAELLGDGWAWESSDWQLLDFTVGVGRDDGVKAGEFCPIFYKTSELQLISNDNFWLSETPFEPSRYPGAGCHRLCTVARFRLVSKPSQTFTLFNAHLDHYSDKSRRVAASLLLTRARFEVVNTVAPVFIVGDFNSASTGSDSGGYKITTGASPPLPVDPGFAKKYGVTEDQMPDFRMLDLRAETPRRNVSANFATFTGFREPSDTSDWSRIDFIFGGSNKGWTSNSYVVRSVLLDDGMLASDHRPVFADITFLPAP
ncbi:hypothetical protein K443DRAFT_120801 [Laccaria amethystina LaAM-08-1]|uniref:Endonuclease/exonuclease/phosphatase domain-containing protein n=1 Tax=Laccaria amethystina LaAM-08-1 TaxID=1095629 RepID=A0A0C9WYD0_9AGAR|nr:hypothetical protein K443DRAFT_120801 [Laccaria amethystina LaAM-08-1]